MENLISEIVAWIFGAGLVLNAALFIPQAIKIFKEKTAKGVSLITFGGFNVLQLTAVLHGYFNEDPFLMWGMAVSFVACGAVTIGRLIYGNKNKTA